jgi:hypothetical protein
MQKYLYQFSESERRVVIAAQQKYLAVVSVILDLHQITSGTLANDLSGIISADPEPQT